MVMVHEYIPFQNGVCMKALLESVPTLARTYGKWPSYFVVVLGMVQIVAAVALAILLQHLL